MHLKIIHYLRYLCNLPLRLILFLSWIYIKIIRFLDYKNYSKAWEEKLQNYIDISISSKIFIEKKNFIRFYCPNTITSYRAKTFFFKEPETINWINSYGGKNKILYDIGANVGLYSIYYSKKFNAKSYAFEPSFKNLEILTRNIRLNNLKKFINVIPNAVTKEQKISDFFQLNYVAGNAGATFDDELVENKLKDFTNKSFLPIKYKTLGTNLDYLINHNIIKKPDLIKIDVDGNELDVISGLKNFLKRKVKISILIEIDSRLKRSKSVHNLLKENKFELSNYKNNNFIYSK